MAKELIVRELSATHTNTTAIAVNASENSNNIARFFNDTPFDLNLVAVRVASIHNKVVDLADTARQEDSFCVAEVSRQATIGQAEGIIASARSTTFVWGNSNVNGGKASYTQTIGEHYVGDFKTTMIVLETETNIFLNSQIANLLDSLNTIAIGGANHFLGCTLYFSKKGSR